MRELSLTLSAISHTTLCKAFFRHLGGGCPWLGSCPSKEESSCTYSFHYHFIKFKLIGGKTKLLIGAAQINNLIEELSVFLVSRAGEML